MLNGFPQPDECSKNPPNRQALPRWHPACFGVEFGKTCEKWLRQPGSGNNGANFPATWDFQKFSASKKRDS
jgi:hypothetical protein